MRGGGAGSRRASGLAGALGSGGPGVAGRRRLRAGPGALDLNFPPPVRVRRGRRALKSGKGRCGPRCSCADRCARAGNRCARAGIGVGGRAAARRTDRPYPRSRQRAFSSPGPFPSYLSCLPEALGLRELPHCFSSRLCFLRGLG